MVLAETSLHLFALYASKQFSNHHEPTRKPPGVSMKHQRRRHYKRWSKNGCGSKNYPKRPIVKLEKLIKTNQNVMFWFHCFCFFKISCGSSRNLRGTFWEIITTQKTYPSRYGSRGLFWTHWWHCWEFEPPNASRLSTRSSTWVRIRGK